ncbi:MAG: hypothetical protein L0Y54_14170 [Sporichthyaceae bacterium]|nr:hypothetical protein [Sporichthyaceae bacterium]
MALPGPCSPELPIAAAVPTANACQVCSTRPYPTTENAMIASETTRIGPGPYRSTSTPVGPAITSVTSAIQASTRPTVKVEIPRTSCR